jgi:hypothetical protein
MNPQTDAERYYTPFPFPFSNPHEQEIAELNQTVAALHERVALLVSELRLWCGGLLPGERLGVDGDGGRVV